MTTQPTGVGVESFLHLVGERRQREARVLIALMRDVSGEEPVMWGPSIIGFGSRHYRYVSGREGDMPRLSFSPRKGSTTVYVNEGFGPHAAELPLLGRHRTSVGCLYVNALDDIDLGVLRRMLERSLAIAAGSPDGPTAVDG